MNCKTVGAVIKKYRLEKEYTQIQLAQLLNISDKAVSKWENGRGCPDISLVPELSRILGVDVSAILEPEKQSETERKPEMKNCKFYVCPECDSISISTGNAQLSCCNRTLNALEAKKAQENQRLDVALSDGERYVTSNHPMTKQNYIRFVAFLSGENLSICKQYPEWNLSARFIGSGVGKLIWYSEKDGLLYQYV